MELFLEKTDHPLRIGCIKTRCNQFLHPNTLIVFFLNCNEQILASNTYLIKAGGGVIGAVDTTLFDKGVSDSEEELKGWAEVVIRWG